MNMRLSGPNQCNASVWDSVISFTIFFLLEIKSSHHHGKTFPAMEADASLFSLVTYCLTPALNSVLPKLQIYVQSRQSAVSNLL